MWILTLQCVLEYKWCIAFSPSNPTLMSLRVVECTMIYEPTVLSTVLLKLKNGIGTLTRVGLRQ